MNLIIGAILMLVGSGFMLLAAVGLLKMPDFLTRLHCSTKAGTLGIGMIFLSVAVDYQELGITTRAIAAFVFLVLTAPVGAHVIGRAAYFRGTPLWKGTFIDELEAGYRCQDPESVKSPDPNRSH